MSPESGSSEAGPQGSEPRAAAQTSAQTSAQAATQAGSQPGPPALRSPGEPSEAAAPPEAARLLPPLARLLRPLVRLLIRSGVTFPAAAQLLRELYVQVAETEFALADKGQTDSRVSLLTGIHRKEVRRLRGAGVPVAAMPAALSRTSRILARWMGDPAFTDEAGQPLPLLLAPRRGDAPLRGGQGEAPPRGGGDADGPSFEALVAAVTRDVRPRAVLDEWLRRGMVSVDADERVRLMEAAVVPGGGEQQLYYFGRNLGDHLCAAVENVTAARPPFFERAVHYDGLTRGTAETLERRARALATRALQAANRDALAATDRQEGVEGEASGGGVPGGEAPGGEGGRWRWNFGIYVYAEEEPAAPGPGETVAGMADPDMAGGDPADHEAAGGQPAGAGPGTGPAARRLAEGDRAAGTAPDDNP